MTASGAHHRMSQARERLTELRQAQEAEAAKARAFKDDRLTDSGQAQRRAELVAEVQAKYVDQFRALRTQVDTDHQTLTAHLNDTRPRIADDAAAVMRAQSKWDSVRMRLEAGMRLSTILRTADTETALAIREWGPAWFEAQAYKVTPGGLEKDVLQPDVDALLRSVDDRLVETNAGRFRDAVTYARTAERIKAGADPLLNHQYFGAMGAPSSTGLGAAIESRRNEKEAAKRFVDPDPDAGAPSLPDAS